MIVCLYFYCKATAESKEFESHFGEWAKIIVKFKKEIVDDFF